MIAQPRNDRWMKWLLAALVGSMLGCAWIGFGAQQKASAVESRQEATEEYLREALTQIQEDVREIRRNQTELMRRQP